jgi:aldehyde:ferredoxin oxidoreductase
MTYGWRGQYLEINLDTWKYEVKPISRDILVNTIGGIGFASHLVYELVPPDADPLGSDNILVFSAGPLSGTTWAGTGRLVIAGKSPLTGLWGEASMGGYFATQLKRAGYDAIVVRGISPQPVSLVILEDEVQFVDAKRLWGMETYKTEDVLLSQYPNSEAITIGPAGENLVPMASLVHHKGNNVAARCGLGAVAGSKRLKSLVARGNTPVDIADPEKFKVLKKEAIDLFNQDGFIYVIQKGGGTAAATPIAIEMADMTAKNWDLDISDWGKEKAMKITGPEMKSLWPSKTDTCYACPVACKWKVTATQISGEEGHMAGPEYESLAGLGSQTMSNDPLLLVQSADLCNRLGLDTISAGATIAWALEAHEKGLLLPDLIDKDLNLVWGDPVLVQELVNRIGNNKPGLGHLLGKGSFSVSQEIGAGQEFAIQVKGLELPFHHPRALRGLEIAYATLPRGATHNEEGSVQDAEYSTYEEWVRAIIHNMDLSGANNSMVYCQFLAGALNKEYTATLLSAVTGETYKPVDLIRVGERNWYIRRAFNLRLGVGLEADTLPNRIVQQIQDSPAPLNKFGEALEEFHSQRELDKRGVPSANKLIELGLEEMVIELSAV